MNTRIGKVWWITLFALLAQAAAQKEGDDRAEAEKEKWFDSLFEMQEKMRPKSPHEKQHRSNLAEYAPVVAQAREGTAIVLNGERAVVLATVVSESGIVLSKASELPGNSLVLQFTDQSKTPAQVLKIFKEYDLAILKAEGGKLKPVEWAPGKDLPVGTLVAAPGMGPNPIAFGTVSVATRKLSEARKGFLGVAFRESKDGKMIVDQVIAKTAAAQAGIRINDVLLAVDGKAVQSSYEFLNTVANYMPGDAVELRIRRGNEEQTLHVTLGDRESGMGLGGNPQLDATARMGVSLSRHRSGYPLALEHDLMLKANQCGGPLVNIEGKVVGINIARAGRVKSYALPSEVVRELLGEPEKLLELANSGQKLPIIVEDPRRKELAENKSKESVSPKPEATRESQPLETDLTSASVEELQEALELAEQELLKAKMAASEARQKKLRILKALREAEIKAGTSQSEDPDKDEP